MGCVGCSGENFLAQHSLKNFTLLYYGSSGFCVGTRLLINQ